MYGMGVLLGFVVGITERIPGFGIVRLQAYCVPQGACSVVIFLQVHVCSSKTMPCITVTRLVAYRFPISVNRLLVLFEMRASTCHLEPARCTMGIAADLLLVELQQTAPVALFLQSKTS